MPKHVVNVRRWGASQAVTIPAFLHRQLKWRVGQLLHIQVENGCVVLRPLNMAAALRPETPEDSVTNGDNVA